MKRTTTFAAVVGLACMLALPAAAQDTISLDIPLSLPTTIAEGRPVSITDVACIGDDQDEQRATYDAQLARFMEVYPNVTVTRTQYCFSAESFAALVAAGNLPTLFELPATEYRRVIENGTAVNLAPYFEKFGLTGVFNPTLMALLSDAEGNPYGFPFFSYAQGIGWDIPALTEAGFDGPPQTWEELGEMARALTDPASGRAGFAMFLSGGAGGWHWTNMAYGFGATELIRDNGDGTFTATYGEGPAVEAMQFLYNLRWPNNALPLDLNSNPTFETIDGRAVIFMSPADGSLGWLRVNMPDVDLTRFGYTAMPQAPDGKRYTLTGGSARFVYSGASADQQEAAVALYVWRTLSEDEFATGRAIFHATQAGAGTPVLPIYAGELQAAVDAFDQRFITMPVENYAGFYEALDAGEIVLVPEPPFAQDFYVAIAEVLTTILTDQSADVAALMAANAANFQSGILDAAR
ncbi:extracellular solute-binding protein [Aggregatilineales bacterium SYSU G02658]